MSPTSSPLLLCGAQGQLGFELQRALAPLGRVVAVDRDVCDLADADAIFRLIERERPRAIVNAAAYTAVDKAETEVALATAINAVAPGILGEAAKSLGIPVVHYSTDYVFDGDADRPYREDDVPNPKNVYGMSKWQGERALAAATERHLIFRTSWVFGAHGGNFLKTMLKLGESRTALNVVCDQIGAPTPAHLLADITAQALARYFYCAKEARPFPFGLYHLTAAGATSWFDYAAHVFAAARRAGFPLALAPDGLHPIPAASYPLPARRPANSRLDCARIEQSFDLVLPPWQQGVEHVLTQLLEKRP